MTHLRGITYGLWKLCQLGSLSLLPFNHSLLSTLSCEPSSSSALQDLGDTLNITILVEEVVTIVGLMLHFNRLLTLVQRANRQNTEPSELRQYAVHSILKGK